MTPTPPCINPRFVRANVNLGNLKNAITSNPFHYVRAYHSQTFFRALSSNFRYHPCKNCDIHLFCKLYKKLE